MRIWLRIVAITSALSLMAAVHAVGRHTTPVHPGNHPLASDTSLSLVQDGRFIKKLEWTSPYGEMPGTYKQYIAEHPMTRARFSAPIGVLGGGDIVPQLEPPPQVYSTLSILVDETLYPEIAQALREYRLDLAAEGFSTLLQTISGGTPEDIKAWAIGRYGNGTRGVVFVGEITAAWAEVSGSVFPCDLFYMDLDGNWEDRDDDGDYEIHTSGDGDQGPEIYVGRINAHTLTYDSEADMVNDYFAKAHDYRMDELTQPWRGLEYVDEDWYSMDVHLDLIYGHDVVRHDFGYFTTGADYLDQMDLGQHFVQVCAHSYSGGHHFGTRPTECVTYAHIYVHSPTTRPAKLLMGSDDGCKVWLNGEVVLNRDVYSGWNPDQYRVDVTLNEGWNRLLCKISQGGGDYEFSARFTDTDFSDFDDLTYQIDNPDTQGSSNYIRTWLLNGFHQDTSGNFWNYLDTNYLGAAEDTINPEEGEGMGGRTWTRFGSSHDYTDMAGYSGGARYGVCYAFVTVHAESERQCQLWLGYDDGARVWLNGSEVLYDNRRGGYVPDMTKVDVTLNAGENRLLVKISQWLGAQGFCARFCYANGDPVLGLSYDPGGSPVSYIGLWLINGLYCNDDQYTRLSEDYLGGEADVTPSEGDSAPYGTWVKHDGDGYPVDLNAWFNKGGDWVLSSDVQYRDPPVLFYNLFACGPGRFTDSNYLAGAYIFNTTWGLITVASSKSGSMLNFHYFTRPLGRGATIGGAFEEWFDAQAPYEQWERGWYYGMVVCGDPTLRVVK